jgi:signal transduction histidine kinase
MRRLSQDKGLSIETQVSPTLRFRGEQRDFEEMLGNLVDNACKWGRSRVRITADLDNASDAARPFLIIAVDDDGPGLNPEARQEATKRGRRLDESVPGSGLGLSIVTDLVSAYGGRFTLDASELGGLSARVHLPAL